MNGFQIARNFVVSDPQLTFNMSTEMTTNEGYRGVATNEHNHDDENHDKRPPRAVSFWSTARRQPISSMELQTGRDFRRSSSSWICIIPTTIVAAGCLITILIYALDPTRCRLINHRKPLLPLADPATPPFTEESRQHRPFRLALMGDSMVIDPEWQHFGLQSGIQQHLPQYHINFTNLGRNGARMVHARIDIDAHIFNRSSPSSLQYGRKFPDGILLSTNSDISDEDFDQDVADGRYLEVRRKYAEDLTYVVNVTLSQGVFIALTSPGAVFKEGWGFLAPNTLRFRHKAAAFADYSSLTQQIAATFNIPYIDLGTPFRKAIPWYRVAYSGCVTRDGEHSNQAGVDIMSLAFATVVNEWFFSIMVKEMQ